MAKGQKKSSKEIRKPKKDRSKDAAPSESTFGSQMKKAQGTTPGKQK